MRAIFSWSALASLWVGGRGGRRGQLSGVCGSRSPLSSGLLSSRSSLPPIGTVPTRAPLPPVAAPEAGIRWPEHVTHNVRGRERAREERAASAAVKGQQQRECPPPSPWCVQRRVPTLQQQQGTHSADSRGVQQCERAAPSLHAAPPINTRTAPCAARQSGRPSPWPACPSCPRVPPRGHGQRHAGCRET